MPLLSPHIIPKPVQMNVAEGCFTFNTSTCIYCVPTVIHEAEMFQTVFKRSTGIDLKIEKLQEEADMNFAKGKTNALLLLLDKGHDTIFNSSKDPTNEGYSLIITAQSIIVLGRSNAGIFYGLQTIRQLLPPEIESAVPPIPKKNEKSVEWSVPCLEIVDYPRFGWRGHMIDEVRHFFGKTFVKRNIDLMALYKLNKLHWHLTDDEGWRIESKKYPKLNEIGSKRLLSKKWKESPNLEDPKWYGGYYTKEELREIIQYAAERYIEVIPEIEMPGHATAPLVAYPEFSCSVPQSIVPNVGAGNRHAYCPSRPEVYQFLQNVLDEVMDIFPTDKIHLGGDELPTERWQNCSVCQQYMKEHNIPDLDEMQVEFAAKNIKYLNSKDRQAIGWFDFSVDRLLQKDIPPTGVIFQFWVGSDEKAKKFIEKGGSAIISNHRFCYLDYPHNRIWLKKAYDFDPIPTGLAENYHKQVLGIEAPIWTERVWNIPKMDFQVFPRLIAYAETAWTQATSKDYKDFLCRLKHMLPRLDLIGIYYAKIFEATNSFLAKLIPSKLRREGYQVF